MTQIKRSLEQMTTEIKLLNNLRKATSPKMVLMLNLMMLFCSLVLVFSTTLYWRLCRKFMDASGLTFSEIIADVDYTASFTGIEVGAIVSCHKTMYMLLITVGVLTMWLLMPFITKRRRRILKMIECATIKQ